MEEYPPCTANRVDTRVAIQPGKKPPCIANPVNTHVETQLEQKPPCIANRVNTRVVAQMEKKPRRGKVRTRKRAHTAAAMKIMGTEQSMAKDDIKMAQTIRNRIGDPNGALDRNPLVVAGEKSIIYARKGRDSIALSKSFGASSATRTVREDWRRPGGPIIAKWDPDREFEDAISRYLYEKV